MLHGLPPSKALRGRFVKLEYCETEGVAAFPRIARQGIVLTKPTFVSGFSWREFPIHHQSINSFSVKTRETVQGNIYDIELNFTKKGFDDVELEEMAQMADPKRKFILKITTPDNEMFLPAVLEFPASFTFSANGGGTETELRRANCQFRASMPFPMQKTLN